MKWMRRAPGGIAIDPRVNISIQRCDNGQALRDDHDQFGGTMRDKTLRLMTVLTIIDGAA